MSLAFLDISINALLPLFFHMPIEMGSVGLDPVSIGYIMGFYGVGTGVFQILFFSTSATCHFTSPLFDFLPSFGRN